MIENMRVFFLVLDGRCAHVRPSSAGARVARPVAAQCPGAGCGRHAAHRETSCPELLKGTNTQHSGHMGPTFSKSINV